MHYRNIYKNEHMDIQVQMHSQYPPTDGVNTPNPSNRRENVHITY